MNAKRMLVAGLMALEMSIPLAGYAASTPRPAPDSETTASEGSALVAQPRDRRERRRRAHRRGWEEARRQRQRGGSGRDVARAYERSVRRDPEVNINIDVCLAIVINQANIIANNGGSGDQVIQVIQNGEALCD